MALISSANMLLLLDHFGAAYAKILATEDTVVNVASPVLGTVQELINRAQTVIVGSADFDVETDLLDGVHTSLTKANAEQVATFATNMLDALNSHCSEHGSSVAAAISDLDTFLTYYNTTAYANLVTPDFAKLFTAVKGAALTIGNVMSPGVHPTLVSTVSANGMGKRAVGGSFTAGTDVDTTLYSAVVPTVEVTVDFSGGSAPPTVLIAGTDNTGATTTTWSPTLSGNNPTAALSTTITPGVTAAARQTVVVASLTGIVAGAVLTVNAGLVDQEVIVVESINGGAVTLTAVFAKAHTAGAALTGFNTYTTTPSVAGRRCTHVSSITIGVTGHAAGTVRVCGKQDRVSI